MCFYDRNFTFSNSFAYFSRIKSKSRITVSPHWGYWFPLKQPQANENSGNLIEKSSIEEAIPLF